MWKIFRRQSEFGNSYGGVLADFDLKIPMPAGVKPPRVAPVEQPPRRPRSPDKRIYRLKRDIAMLFGPKAADISKP
jgi:hypothetical protein